jgi:putative peptidoglycan lipid II flippase
MSRKLAKSAGVIGLATFASRILGLLRDMVQAYFFATGKEADAFVVATRIPTLLRDLFAEGAMSAAFVPTFSRYLAKGGKEAAWRLGSQVISALLVGTSAVVVLGIVFAAPLTRLYGSGFADTPDKLQLTISLARVNMPFLLLVAIAAACMGMLNALRRFFIPASSPALYNIVNILTMATCVPLIRYLDAHHILAINPVMALSMGMLLGGVAQIAAQWPALRAEGYQYTWQLDPRDPGLREVLLLMGPGVLGGAAAQINLLVNTSLATHEDGAASALGYAFRLMYMPVGIIGVSVATAALPELARLAADKAHSQMKSTLSWGLRLMLMLSVPATVGLMVLATPIVELLFGYGMWGNDSTRNVSNALLYYAPGIVGYSIVKIATPTFYSMGDARTPSIVSFITILVNLGLNLWLNSIMGFRGLALGTAIAANINAVVLLYLLKGRIGGLEGYRLGASLLKIAVAAGIMGATAYFAHQALVGLLPPELFGHRINTRILTVSGGIGAGVASLALTAWLLHIDEFHQALNRVLRRTGVMPRDPAPPS